jgi:hypothetical protein
MSLFSQPWPPLKPAVTTLSAVSTPQSHSLLCGNGVINTVPFSFGHSNRQWTSIILPNVARQCICRVSSTYPSRRARERDDALEDVQCRGRAHNGKTSLESLWPKVGEGVWKTDAEHAKVANENRLAENVSVILVNCGAHVNLMPCFWDQGEMARMEPLPFWKGILKEITKVQRC